MSVENTVKKYRVMLLFLIVLWLGTAMWLVYVIRERNQLQFTLSQTVTAKDQVEGELTELYTQYDELETDNDSIQVELQRKKQKIQGLIEEVKKVRYATATQIKEYKEQIRTYRDIMRNYVHTIDSLNTLNHELMAENTTIKNEYRKVKTDYESVQEEKEALSGKVEKAAGLELEELRAMALKRNGSETTWPGLANSIRVCFQIDENPIAPKGNRMVYVRIKRPDDFILINSRDNLFVFDGKKIAFSAAKQVNYQGADTQVCLNYTLKEKPISGKYKAAIFMEGRKIKEVPFELR